MASARCFCFVILSTAFGNAILSCCLFQVQLEYTSKPTLFYAFTKSFATFLKDTGVIAHTTEDALSTLADEFGMRIVETDGIDVDKVPYVMSRPELPFGVLHSLQ
jgi:hypothetical protein